MNSRLIVGLVSASLVIAGCSSTESTDQSTSTTGLTTAGPTTTGPITTVANTGTGSPATTTAAAPTTTASQPTEVEATFEVGQWNEVIHDEDCVCSDGSEFAFYEQAADPTKVVLVLEGGGACWNSATCDPGRGVFTRTLQTSGRSAGIYDRNNPDNPFAEHSIVYVPYCTGDVHLGNAVADYGDGLTISHTGSANVASAIDWMQETYPDAAEIFVTGMSAGSIPVPLYSQVVAERWPSARVAGLGDSSGAYPASDVVAAELLASWGLEDAFYYDPAWVEAVQAQGFAGLFVEAGARNADIDFGRFDYDSDGVQTFFIALSGLPQEGSLRQMMDANEALVEGAGVALSDYALEGFGHTILSSGDFLTSEVDGITLAEWVGALAAGEQPDDVG
jgi:hypothetical protein